MREIESLAAVPLLRYIRGFAHPLWPKLNGCAAQKLKSQAIATQRKPSAMIKRLAFLFFAAIFACIAPSAFAQSDSAKVPGAAAQDMREFVETPAILGYESALAAKIRDRLKSFSPQLNIKSDNLGDVIVTIGSGGATRLIVAPMDEPGYVVSNITSDGYIQLQRLPQFGVLPLFNELYAAQPVEIETPSGKWIPAVVAGLSVHLQPGRLNPPNPDYIENMWVDTGTSSAAEVKRIGADLLSPVVIDRTLYNMGPNFETSPAIGDRFGDVALVELLRRIDASKINGTLVVTFVAQQWAGARGLERVLDELPAHADELIFVGRLTPSPPSPAEPTLHRAPRRELGSGVLVGDNDVSDQFSDFASQLKQLAGQNQIPFVKDYSAPLMPPSYLANPETPQKTVHLAIATAWPSTPAEMISTHDLANLTDLLEAYAQGSVAPKTTAIGNMWSKAGRRLTRRQRTSSSSRASSKPTASATTKPPCATWSRACSPSGRIPKPTTPAI